MIDENVTAIADYAFAYCQHLRSITIGTQVETIGDHAFDAVNDALCLVVQDGSPAQLWASAHGVRYASESTSFSYRLEGDKAYITGYTGTLPDVVVPAVIDGYPVYAIENLRSPILTHVVVSEGIEVIGDSAFKAYFDYEKGYIRTLVSVSLPQSLKIISDDGFWGQENLQEITLGSVVEIGQSAFGSCTMLKQITLPDTLTTIGWRAFESSGLTSLTIPVNVTSLGDSFITDCSALTSLYVAEGNPTYEMEDGLLYDIPAKTLRYALPDVSGDVVIRDGTVRIGDDVFKEHAITSVQLPDSLQKIGNCAFQFCKELKEITFPEGLITIDGLAFAYCTQLENVVLPEGLKSLGDSAFRSCDSLTEITVPEGITFMSGTFATCYSLRTVNLPSGLTHMMNGVVEGCRSLETLHLPAKLADISGEWPSKLKTITTAFGSVRYVSEDGILYDTQDNSILFVNASITGNVTVRDGITTIGAGAFKGRKGLTSVTLPESCTVIDSYAFENCTALTDINFPEKLELIGRNAFYNSGITSLKLSQPGLHVGSFAFTDCHQLKSVEITSTDFDLMEWAFARCENLETVILPPQVFRMEGGCFTECTSLTTVVLPKNITFVHGFKGCTSLKTIEIPDSVTSIGYEAFANCKSLESIHLPDGVTNIGDLAFARCFALKDVNFPAALTTIGKEAFRSVPIAEVVIPANVTEIADMAFYYNEELRSLTLPNGLKKIGESAFWNASKLQTVELPESLTEIGETAFRQSGLTSITIPGDVKRIGTGAFAACENLEKVSVAPGVETIGSEAFTGCTKLTEATLTSSVTTIEGGAFYGCKALQTISGGALIQFIGENAFMNCENLEELNISPNLTEIQGHAFDGCKTLKRVSPSAEQKGVSLPHVKYIGERAFNVCKAIPSFSLGDSLETVGDYAFASTSVTSMYFPDTVKQIGINPMWMNYAILSVHLSKSLTEIPQGMFAQATRIQTLTIPQGVRSIGTQAFHGNVALAALKLPDGLERIGANAFGNAMLLLEIPASVTEIADDAFSEAVVEFYTPSGSAAHQYALAHQIPVHLDESIPAEYLGTADQLAAKIVAQVITDDMTDYQKAEALVDWMLSETMLSDMLPHTYSGKMVLTLRKGTRWGWAFAYKALLNAANVTNGIYFNAKGIVEGAGIGNQTSVFVSYFDGDAVNMIQIDGQWYFTHPAFVEHFGKARYFMLNRETYRLSFGDDPKVKDCDNYDQTFLYQAYSKNIEAEVVAQASASFTEGKKLVYAEVQPIEELMDASYAYVLDFAGRHMDTLDWQNAQGEFEPTIIGTNNGYWLSDDLTGEYAQVTVNTQTLYPYGAEVRLDDPEYTAMLCDWNVDGTLTLTESTEEATVALFTIERGEDIEKKQTITGRKVYHATFTPTLSQYIDTLAPTEFDLVLECQLPRILDVSELVDNKLTLTLSDSHIFPENAQLDLIFWPQDGISSAPITHFYVEDRAELYPDGKREITLDLSALRCDLGYALYIAQTADNYVESEQSYVTSRIDIPHTPYIETVRPATPTEDGLVSATVCRICDTWLGNGYAIASDHILQLPANLKAIEEEAFVGMWQVQQVNIPEGVTAIGKRAFADCTLLRLVIIPNSVQTLADDAFSGCHPVILCDAENQQVIDWANAQGLMVVFKESK
ncbi:MAG: leucine-rich repeat protein [Christensenellales bacterium]